MTADERAKRLVVLRAHLPIDQAMLAQATQTKRECQQLVADTVAKIAEIEGYEKGEN